MTRVDFLIGMMIVAYGIGVLTGVAVFPYLFPRIVFG